MMFKKIIAQVSEYTTTLTKADFDSNESKIDQEIKNIENKFPLDQQIAVNVNFNNKKQKVDQFLKLLKQQLQDIKEKKDIRNQYDTNLFHNIDGNNIDVSVEENREGLKRDIAALERQIQEREETLAEIDNYVVTLLTGETAQLNIAHTNAKFVKVADQPTQEEVL